MQEKTQNMVARDNTEKIWAHRFFAKQKRNVAKASKTSAGGLGPGQSPGGGSGGEAPENFRVFFVRNEEKHRFRG